MINPSNLVTVRDLIRYAATTFAEHDVDLGQGTESNFDEACFLILRSLSLPLNSLDIFLDARLVSEEINQCMKHITARAKERIPAAYVLNEAWLRDYKFYVNEDVLIPRSHIADIIFDQTDVWFPESRAIDSILDLCTGSGCLAILAAHHFRDASVVASDISTSALQVCHKNITSYDLEQAITSLESDLFANIHNKFDLIISNPPYVDQCAMSQLPIEFRKEPELALAGGEDGVDLIQKIIKQAPHHLNTEGILLMEVGRDREVIEKMFPKIPFTWIETPSGHDFVFLVTREELCLGLAD
jgi:ribosomal protein L3 glutamine methyltransferase